MFFMGSARFSHTVWRRAAALFAAFLVCTALWAEAAQAQLADHVIRLHVLANSDSQEDQALKLQVRDAVLAHLKTLDDRAFSVLCCDWTNRRGDPPMPIFLWKEA